MNIIITIMYKVYLMKKLDFNIEIDDNENFEDTSKFSKSCIETISQIDFYKKYQVVDMGLPSKTLWSKYNVGVDILKLDNNMDWFGLLYAWGESKHKPTYLIENYEYFKIERIDESASRTVKTKYSKNDELTHLELQDDVAYKLNNFSTIPTKDQYKELFNYVDEVWVKNYNEINGLNGILLTSRINKNTLFFPATKYVSGSYICKYWTADLDPNNTNTAYCFECSEYTNNGYGSKMLETADRWNGYAIRSAISNF